MEESIKTGRTNKAVHSTGKERARSEDQGIEMEGMSAEDMTLIERLNKELAETGELYARLSEESDEDENDEAEGEQPAQALDALEDSLEDDFLDETDVDSAQPLVQSPVMSANEAAFAQIPEALRLAIQQKGYHELTTVQHAVLAPESRGRDLQLSSQTGSGKTVALGILIAEGLIRAVESGHDARPLALVITPTRELASQVQKELNWLYAKVRGLSVAVCTGGTSVGMERRNLERGPAVVVGTPGRLLDHISSGALKCEGIAQVVLDEADQMLDMGFREELEGILERTPKERSTHMVSATFPAGIQKLAHRYQNKPVQVEGTRLGKANADIEHVAHLVFEPDRYAALVNLLLLSDEERVLIFVNTRADTTDMAEALTKDGFSAVPLSGELVQAQRTRTLAAFRSGAVKVLVATDVAARGLDIPDVGMVIQAATPMDADIYIHRSGRTGRAGQKGLCVLLVPARRERQLKRMLNDAGVESNWCDIPTREQVEKAVSKRSRKRLFDAIDAEADIPEAELSYAQKLADERDPVRVIATLLRLTKPAKQREAMEIEPAQSFTRGWKHRERERMQDNSGAPAPAPRAAAHQGQQERPRSGADSVRFSVSWGFRDGANPQRLLAMLCRRGDIAGRSVGAIDLGPTDSSFEIKSSDAEHFEKRASVSDPREPNVRITRGDARPNSGGGYQARPEGGRSQAGAGYAGRSSGYQGRGAGDRSSSGGGYQGRGPGQGERSYGGAGGGYRGNPERSYNAPRSYGNSGYQGRDNVNEGRSGGQRAEGGEQRSGGFQGGGQRPGSGYQGGGYRGGQNSGSGYQGGGYQGGGYQGGGYQGGGKQVGGYRGGAYQGDGQRSDSGYQGGGYRGSKDSGSGYQGAPRSGGYGESKPGNSAPKRGFQKRDEGQEKRPYGRHSGYRSNSGDYSAEGGFRGRGNGPKR